MSATAIDLFVQALPAAAGQALSEKSPSPWTVSVDEKPRPLPSGVQVLNILLIAEPSKAEAAIQISVESALLLAAMLGGTGAAPAQFQPEHAQAVRELLAK